MWLFAQRQQRLACLLTCKQKWRFSDINCINRSNYLATKTLPRELAVDTCIWPSKACDIPHLQSTWHGMADRCPSANSDAKYKSIHGYCNYIISSRNKRPNVLYHIWIIQTVTIVHRHIAVALLPFVKRFSKVWSVTGNDDLQITLNLYRGRKSTNQ